MVHQFRWLDPRLLGVIIAIGASVLLVLAAEHHGQEYMVGLSGILLMGVHISLSPRMFRTRSVQLTREERRDYGWLVATLSFLLLGAYVVIEFLIR